MTREEWDIVKNAVGHSNMDEQGSSVDDNDNWWLEETLRLSEEMAQTVLCNFQHQSSWGHVHNTYHPSRTSLPWSFYNTAYECELYMNDYHQQFDYTGTRL
jgi:hypothetical protein